MQLTRLARDTVEKLLAETGHTLSVDDCAHVWSLNAAAERVSHPHKCGDIDLVEMPRAVGGVVLHPLTLGAWQWLEQYALPALGDHWLADIAVPYAMSLAHEPERLREDATPRQLRRSLRAFLRGMSCTAAQLMRVVSDAIGDGGDGDGDGDGEAKFGPVIALLCREYGATPEYWAWDASTATVKAMLDAYSEKASAEMSANAKAAAGPKGSVSITPPAKIDAHKRFKRASAALRDRWQKT